jgi:hypothetical protein
MLLVLTGMLAPRVVVDVITLDEEGSLTFFERKWSAREKGRCVTYLFKMDPTHSPVYKHVRHLATFLYPILLCAALGVE